jgi:hypothetical protein
MTATTNNPAPDWPPVAAILEARIITRDFLKSARGQARPELAAAFAKLESELAKGHPNPEPQDDE